MSNIFGKLKLLKSRKYATILFGASVLVAAVFISSNLSVVRVSDGDRSQNVITTKKRSCVEIINQAGFALSANDLYSVSGEGSSVTEIEILRAFDIKVVDGGVAKTVSAVSGTVGEALENAGIPLPDGDDVINTELTAEAEENMEVVIDRVNYVKDVKTKVIKYKTVTKKDSTLESGKTKVSVEGVNGEKKITSVKKYVNGKLADTKTTEKVISKPVNKVVLKGTKPAASAKKSSITSVDTGSRTLTVGGKKISYSKVLTGPGTAYTARRGARTSTGRAVKVGLVAVNPRKIPYGTKLYIVSADGRYTYGYAIAADTGGALRSGRVLVDLFYNTERECLNFGRRQVKVYVLD